MTLNTSKANHLNAKEKTDDLNYCYVKPCFLKSKIYYFIFYMLLFWNRYHLTLALCI